jgi:hypothetical protein
VTDSDTAPEEERAHKSLWGNIGVLHGVLVNLVAESQQEGDDQGAQAFQFVADKVAEMVDAPSWSELWDNLEFLYRKVTAVAAHSILERGEGTYMAFTRSAHMMIRLLQPESTDEQAGDLVRASLNKRLEELREE